MVSFVVFYTEGNNVFNLIRLISRTLGFKSEISGIRRDFGYIVPLSK